MFKQIKSDIVTRIFSHLTQVAETEDRSGMITRPRRPQERKPGCLIFFLK